MTNDKLKMLVEEHLYLKVERGGFTDPNSRTIHLMWRDGFGVNNAVKDTVISSVSFDVVQTREYEG